MPLTAKGSEIMSAMQKEYGAEKGKSVFYASKNAGKISGVDSQDASTMSTVSAIAARADGLTRRADAMQRDCDLMGDADFAHYRGDGKPGRAANYLNENSTAPATVREVNLAYQEGYDNGRAGGNPGDGRRNYSDPHMYEAWKRGRSAGMKSSRGDEVHGDAVASFEVVFVRRNGQTTIRDIVAQSLEQAKKYAQQDVERAGSAQGDLAEVRSVKQKGRYV